MNWGVRIVILYSGFVAMIVLLVSLTMRENVDLVAKDYYEQELKYQDRIDQIERTRLLNEQLTWETKDGVIAFDFPEAFSAKDLQGKISFFMPADATKDKEWPVQVNEQGMQEIPLNGLSKGVYKMQVFWNASGTDYYNEGVIRVN